MYEHFENTKTNFFLNPKDPLTQELDRQTNTHRDMKVKTEDIISGMFPSTYHQEAAHLQHFTSFLTCCLNEGESPINL